MKEFYRRHLPHWQPRTAVFFVTFRLKNSLPDEVIEALKEEREKEAMHYRDGSVYDLQAFCIMSNHVHVVFEPVSRAECYSALRSGCQPDLHKIMQSLKRHTARQANLILGREGPFWQDESYDRVIRDGEEYARIIHYVLENPVTAGLVSKWDEWQWTYLR